MITAHTGRADFTRAFLARAACIILIAFTACLVSGALAASAEYPTKPVRLIVPFGPGGGFDVALRPLAYELSENLGQQFVIDNRAGAGGIVGAEIAARAPPDGYTIFGGSVSVSSLPALHKKLSFDPNTDFAPVTIAISSTYFLLSHPSVAVTTLKDLIALAKKAPGTLHIGSAGKGSTIHLAGEMLRTMAGIDIVHVPYKGAGAAMADLVGGQIQLMFGPTGSTMPMVKAAKLKALGVTSAKRSAVSPDTPTLAESGLPGYEVSGWYGLLVPAGTPKHIINKLYVETKKVLNSDSMKARLHANSLEPLGLSPEESVQFLKTDTARWARVVRDAGIVKD